MNRYQVYVCMIYKIISHFGIISKRNNDLTALSSQTDRQVKVINQTQPKKKTNVYQNTRDCQLKFYAFFLPSIPLSYSSSNTQQSACLDSFAPLFRIPCRYNSRTSPMLSSVSLPHSNFGESRYNSLLYNQQPAHGI